MHYMLEYLWGRCGICIVAASLLSLLTRHVVQLIGPPTAILELLGKGRQASHGKPFELTMIIYGNKQW